MPTAAKFAAIAAPVPPLDPPGLRVGSYGFLVCPPSELIVVMPRANSCRFDLATITAPASRSLLPETRRGRASIPLNAIDAGGRRHLRGVVVVFQDDRNAVEGPRAARRALAVERLRLVERLRVDRDDRVQRRTLMVEASMRARYACTRRFDVVAPVRIAAAARGSFSPSRRMARSGSAPRPASRADRRQQQRRRKRALHSPTVSRVRCVTLKCGLKSLDSFARPSW